jgi:hypothetical protein
MKLTTHLNPVPRSRAVEPYLHTLIRLHGIVLNWFNMENCNFLPNKSVLVEKHILLKCLLNVGLTYKEQSWHAGVLEQCFYWIEAHMKGTSYSTHIFSASNTSTIGVCESSLRHNLIKFLGGMPCINILGMDMLTYSGRLCIHYVYTYLFLGLDYLTVLPIVLSPVLPQSVVFWQPLSSGCPASAFCLKWLNYKIDVSKGTLWLQ